MTIIQIEPLETGQHRVQYQSGRRKCWLDGWVEVPTSLEADVWNAQGFCELEIENEKLVGIIPTDRPKIEDPEPEPTAEEQLRADVDYIAAMTGVTL